jgi:hypothetical protein
VNDTTITTPCSPIRPPGGIAMVLTYAAFDAVLNGRRVSIQESCP